jgi:hypothetical protein
LISIIKYDDYYIRFIGGQYTELPCDIKISKDEAEKIISNPSYINKIFNDYRKRIPWTSDTFIQIGFEDFFKRSNYSKEETDDIICRLNKFNDIKIEMYESIMLEKFPVCGLVEKKGKTAKDFNEERGTSIGESYLLLLELAEQSRA